MDLRWLACNLASGQVVEELPGLTPLGPLSAILATYTATAFSLPIATAPDGWMDATREGQAMIVAMLSGRPIWAGAVLVPEYGSAPEATLGCVSLEGYTNRRYVGDHAWVQQDEASVIAAGIAADLNAEGVAFTVDAAATGTLRDRTYQDQDDKTIYAALRELMGVTDGPEWTTDLSWNDATQTVTKIIRVRKRIGTAALNGVANAVFDSRSENSAQYKLVRDFSEGKGANHVVAVSSGQGDARPQSDPARDIRSGWARWEHRFTPSTSITSVEVLNDHAERSLALMANGAVTLTISARADADPMLGRDWVLGDDIGYDLYGHAHPNGITGIARAIGWKLDVLAGRIEPILLLPGEED